MIYGAFSFKRRAEVTFFTIKIVILLIAFVACKQQVCQSVHTLMCRLLMLEIDSL
jgi:hypothetical protein